MKIIKYSFGFLLGALVFLSSCRDFVDPNIPYSDFDAGVYLRTIDRTSTAFNFFDLPNSKLALTLEAVDAQDGATVENVEIMVQHRRLIAGVGLNYTPATPVLVKTIAASDFAPNSESRFLRTSFEVSAEAAMQAVGLTAADIEGGDVFEFSLVLTDKQGRKFTRDNVTNNVAGAPFFDAPFQYFVSVVCPSDLGGTYTYITTGGTAYGSADSLQEDICPGPLTGEVTFKAVSGKPGAYSISDASFGVWKCALDPNGVSTGIVLNDACGKLSFTGKDTYDGSYTFNFISVDDDNLKFMWENEFGEKGTVALKSNPDKPWPANFQ